MKTRQTQGPEDPGCPNIASLAALRSWYAGLSSRAAVARYLPEHVRAGQSARGVLGGVRRRLAKVARQVGRPDLAAVFEHADGERLREAKAVANAIDVLRHARMPTPQVGDDVAQWLTPRSVQALHAQGILTLADLTVRIARRRRWWGNIGGLGATGAQAIEAFFAAHPALTECARALIAAAPSGPIVRWEALRVPHEVDGSQGTFRAPRDVCTLNATNDYEAVQAWLSLHESAATQRAYRKEAGCLLLWAIVERGRALSSLTTDDAIAYRSFLRRPTPHALWVGQPWPRHSPEWRPFGAPLSPRSTAYALTVLSAMYRWLVEQRYVFANPFAGIKARGGAPQAGLDAARSFAEGEWRLIRTIADGLEWSYGWSSPAAQRLRFLLDFGYATGLRASELVGAKLGDIQTDELGNHWLCLTSKGGKQGKVGLPPLARVALDQYLMQRQLPVTPTRWVPTIPIVASLEDGGAGIASLRLWRVTHRFFLLAADLLKEERPATAEKLRRASPHWLRHTHASHALARGAELVTVRDNLRHASIATTSIYLHGDEVRRAQQLNQAFGRPESG